MRFKTLLILAALPIIGATGVCSQEQEQTPREVLSTVAGQLRSEDAQTRSIGAARLYDLYEKRAGTLTQEVIGATADSLLAIASSHSTYEGQATALGLLRALRTGSPDRTLVSPTELGNLLASVSDRRARVLVVEYVGQHPDIPTAIDELTRIARSAPDGELAVNELTRLGAQGREALRRLHEEGGITSPAARERLNVLSRTGFAVDTVRTGGSP